jgi:hypothetical protein
LSRLVSRIRHSCLCACQAYTVASDRRSTPANCSQGSNTTTCRCASDTAPGLGRVYRQRRALAHQPDRLVPPAVADWAMAGFRLELVGHSGRAQPLADRQELARPVLVGWPAPPKQAQPVLERVRPSWARLWRRPKVHNRLRIASWFSFAGCLSALPNESYFARADASQWAFLTSRARTLDRLVCIN